MWIGSLYDTWSQDSLRIWGTSSFIFLHVIWVLYLFWFLVFLISKCYNYSLCDYCEDQIRWCMWKYIVDFSQCSTNVSCFFLYKCRVSFSIIKKRATQIQISTYGSGHIQCWFLSHTVLSEVSSCCDSCWW